MTLQEIAEKIAKDIFCALDGGDIMICQNGESTPIRDNYEFQDILKSIILNAMEVTELSDLKAENARLEKENEELRGTLAQAQIDINKWSNMAINGDGQHLLNKYKKALEMLNDNLYSPRSSHLPQEVIEDCKKILDEVLQGSDLLLLSPNRKWKQPGLSLVISTENK